MNKNIFRAYDIRGNSSQDLSDDIVKKIGSILGEYVKEFGDSSIYLGHDSRLSKDRIKESLISGIHSVGVDVYYLGLVPTPMVYYATKKGSSNHGVMITGSHNPKEDNGMKIVINGNPVSGHEIKQRVMNYTDVKNSSGKIVNHDFTLDYLDEIQKNAPIGKQMKVVLDAGNGAAGPLARKVFEKIGLKIISINEEPDGNFPNHHPDPGKEKNLIQLKEEMQRNDADIGFAFDGDGDRVGLIAKSGNQVLSDHIIMILSQYFLKLKKGVIVYDVKCSNELPKLILKHGGKPVMEKTGHFNIKNRIKETSAILGGEMSGHIFINYDWYGFDDAIYTAAIITSILSNKNYSLDEMILQYPKTYSTEELNLNVKDEQKFTYVEKFIQKMSFPNADINLLDGVRVSYENSWGLLRASNTSPKLVFRFEGNSQEDLEDIKDKFETNLKTIFPDLELNYS